MTNKIFIYNDIIMKIFCLNKHSNNNTNDLNFHNALKCVNNNNNFNIIEYNCFLMHLISTTNLNY